MKSNSNEKPEIGALVVGRIDKSIPSLAPPDLMLDLRHGFIGRCCITELLETDDWTNFPLGRSTHMNKKAKVKSIADEDEKVDKIEEVEADET